MSDGDIVTVQRLTQTFFRLGPLVLLLALAPAVGAGEPVRRELRYAPSPLDNPLRGLVPYAGDHRARFPHSLEFFYLPLSALVIEKDTYDWGPLERQLDAVAARGHQATFRVYLEYPGKPGAIPGFLIRGGLKVHKYLNTNTQPFPPTEVETPDYEDAVLRRTMTRFVTALGAKYDGDPRVGFITAGLLGTWGEWHDYPRDDLFASKAVQAEVMGAYEAAFRVTPILLRYPAGPRAHGKAANADRRFGYHDDSFAWATLDTGKKQDDWFFCPLLRSAGPAAEAKWKTAPIGGEIRPEAWGRVFDAEPGLPEIQDFARCVEATHVTWLMDSGMFGTGKNTPPETRVGRAKKLVGRMGYEFHVTAVTVQPPSGGRLGIIVEVENRGVAPFYYDWPVEYALIAGGKPVKVIRGTGHLPGLLPGDTRRSWNDRLDVRDVTAGDYVLGLRVPNPLTTGVPLRFANETQDADAPGWLSLGRVSLKGGAKPR